MSTWKREFGGPGKELPTKDGTDWTGEDNTQRANWFPSHNKVRVMDWYCAEYKEATQAEHQRRVRAERVALGLCRDCGQDSGGRYRCEACQAKSAGYVRTASKARANPDVGKDA